MEKIHNFQNHKPLFNKLNPKSVLLHSQPHQLKHWKTEPISTHESLTCLYSTFPSLDPGIIHQFKPEIKLKCELQSIRNNIKIKDESTMTQLQYKIYALSQA